MPLFQPLSSSVLTMRKHGHKVADVCSRALQRVEWSVDRARDRLCNRPFDYPVSKQKLANTEHDLLVLLADAILRVTAPVLRPPSKSAAAVGPQEFPAK